MIYKFIVTLGVLFLLTGCSLRTSTDIILYDMSKEEYEKIKQDIINIANLYSFDCEYNQEDWQESRDKGVLYCDSMNFSLLFSEIKENNIELYYGGDYTFFIPPMFVSNWTMTDEHKKIQKLFLELAKKYHNKYKDKIIEVRFHQNNTKETKQLIIYNKKD